MQNLFGPHPFSTSVGMLVERATDSSQLSEDWTLILEICESLTEYDEGPKDAIKAIRKRICSSVGRDHLAIWYSLILIDACIKHCGKRFKCQVANKDFLKDLIKILSPKYETPLQIQTRILIMIKTWINSSWDVPGRKDLIKVYTALRQKGVQFPVCNDPYEAQGYSVIPTSRLKSDPHIMNQVQQQQKEKLANGAKIVHLQPIQTVNGSKINYAQVITKNPSPQNIPKNQIYASYSSDPHHGLIKMNPQNLTQISYQNARVHHPGKKSSQNCLTQSQRLKLAKDLAVVDTNYNLFIDLLSELQPDTTNADDLHLLHDLYRTCKGMQMRIVEFLVQVDDDKAIMALVHANDNLNSAFIKFNRFEKYRQRYLRSSLATMPQCDSNNPSYLPIIGITDDPQSQVIQASSRFPHVNSEQPGQGMLDATQIQDNDSRYYPGESSTKSSSSMSNMTGKQMSQHMVARQQLVMIAQKQKEQLEKHQSLSPLHHHHHQNLPKSKGGLDEYLGEERLDTASCDNSLVVDDIISLASTTIPCNGMQLGLENSSSHGDSSMANNMSPCCSQSNSSSLRFDELSQKSGKTSNSSKSSKSSSGNVNNPLLSIHGKAKTCSSSDTNNDERLVNGELEDLEIWLQSNGIVDLDPCKSKGDKKQETFQGTFQEDLKDVHFQVNQTEQQMRDSFLEYQMRKMKLSPEASVDQHPSSCQADISSQIDKLFNNTSEKHTNNTDVANQSEDELEEIEETCSTHSCSPSSTVLTGLDTLSHVVDKQSQSRTLKTPVQSFHGKNNYKEVLCRKRDECYSLNNGASFEDLLSL